MASYCLLLLNPGREQKFSHRLPRACMVINYQYLHLVCLPLTGRKIILPYYQNSQRSSVLLPRTSSVPFCFRLPRGIHPSSLVWDCKAQFAFSPRCLASPWCELSSCWHYQRLPRQCLSRWHEVLATVAHSSETLTTHRLQHVNNCRII